jgi:ABC-type multidrug transport system ATPase subunit/pSer/pThr/pTyr-binding forkhead associated (FHA) protein
MVIGQQGNQQTQDAMVAFLSRSVLFRHWPEGDLRAIAGWLRPLDIPAGTTICRQGEPGNEMYLIESGQVRVTSGDGRYVYDHLGPNAFFGEIALLGDGRRTATVTATLPTRVWALPKSSFDHLLQLRPHLREPLQRLATDRLRGQRNASAGAGPQNGPAVLPPVQPNPVQSAPPQLPPIRPNPAQLPPIQPHPAQPNQYQMPGQQPQSFQQAPPPPPPAFGAHERNVLAFQQGKTTMILGRHATCDVVLNDPQVSRFHARIDKQGPGIATITDLGSANGVHINGRRIPANVPQPLRTGDEFWVGINRYSFEENEVVHFSRPSGVKLDAYHLTRIVGKKDKPIRILNDVSLSIQPGEFVCVVGGSGAGKSTLLSALTGFTPATEGKVFYNGIDYYEHFDLFRASLGYVPQDDIIHKNLTVEQVLNYAARLRLPPDTTPEERKERVERAMQQLQLTERRETQVSMLSGGQRKRVSIGVELLNEPGLFFLDEPTSGLDPGLEETMMHLFRDLSRQGRTVIVITHATKNINVCDKVIFLARGGFLAFYGTPKEALEYFGVEDFTGIYRRLESEATPAEWGQRFSQHILFRRNVVEQLNPQLAGMPAQAVQSSQQVVKKPEPSALTQFLVLTARYLAILRRDKVLMALFFLQPPVIAFALTGMFKKDIFTSDPSKAVFLMFISTVASIFLGAMNSAREITKENAIYVRERLVNLKLLPYLFSKIVVLGALSLFQAFVFLVVIMTKVEIPDMNPVMFVKMYATLSLVNLGGMAMGLTVSARVGNEDKATGAVPLMVLPQMSLAGAMIPVSTMPSVGKVLSNLAISRWGFENLGIITKVNNFLPNTTQVPNPYLDVMNGSQVLHFIVLIAFLLILLTMAGLGIKRKDVR